MEPSLIENGSIYFTKLRDYRNMKIEFQKSRASFLNKYESIEIDDVEELNLIQSYLKILIQMDKRNIFKRSPNIFLMLMVFLLKI